MHAAINHEELIHCVKIQKAVRNNDTSTFQIEKVLMTTKCIKAYVESLEDINAITNLDLRQGNIEDDGMKILGEYAASEGCRLKAIDISDNALVTETGWASFLRLLVDSPTVLGDISGVDLRAESSLLVLGFENVDSSLFSSNGDVLMYLRGFNAVSFHMLTDESKSKVDLSNCALNHLSLRGALHSLDRFDNIMCLYLDGCSFGESDDGLSALSSYLEHSDLVEELSVSDCKLCRYKATKLCALVMSGQRLRRINLSRNGMSDDMMCELAKAKGGHAHVERVDVSGNDFGELGALALAQFLADSVRFIDIVGCSFDRNCLEVLGLVKIFKVDRESAMMNLHVSVRLLLL
jgi:hypothetical protein